mmetsp:Transcript_16441/g.35545  ORF Transcript_16441/g.35545 Transcript_16441/m.35545 type:complete len:234 (-) Transcript_16441:1306-2007(-)
MYSNPLSMLCPSCTCTLHNLGGAHGGRTLTLPQSVTCQQALPLLHKFTLLPCINVWVAQPQTLPKSVGPSVMCSQRGRAGCCHSPYPSASIRTSGTVQPRQVHPSYLLEVHTHIHTHTHTCTRTPTGTPTGTGTHVHKHIHTHPRIAHSHHTQYWPRILRVLPEWKAVQCMQSRRRSTPCSLMPLCCLRPPPRICWTPSATPAGCCPLPLTPPPSRRGRSRQSPISWRCVPRV